jgi:translation initiation factor IF-2
VEQKLMDAAGTIDTLRHMKKEMAEVKKGSECGLSVRGFTDFREGDLVQVVQDVEKPGVL